MATGTARILIVEDESVIAMTLESSVEDLGYEVVGHCNSFEAVEELLKEEEVDLVLMDIMLEGEKDGVAAARHIRDEYDIPTVFLTAYSDDPLLQRAIGAEPFGYVLKPYDDRELHINIEIALNKHRTEKELKKTRKRFFDLAESIPQCVFELDANGNLVYMNEVGQRIFGIEREGWSISDLMPEAEAERAWENIRKKLAGHHILGTQYRMLDKDGELFPVEVHSKVISDKNGELKGVKGVIIDISERVKDQEQIKVLSKAVDESKDLIYITDPQGVIEYANPRIFEHTGFFYEEVVGKRPNIFKSGEQEREFYQSLWETVTAGKSFEGEFVNQKKDGELYYEHKVITPLMNEGGDIEHFVSIGRDITWIKQAEEELRKSREREQMSRSKALIKGQEEERSRVAKELHDSLGQTLVATNKYLDAVIQKEEDQDLQRELASAQNLILEMVEEVKNISNNLMPNVLRDFGISAGLKKVVSLFSNSGEDRIRLKLDPDIGKCPSEVELTLLRVAQEALSNAVKYSEARRIDVELTKKDSGLILRVRDDGKGMDLKNGKGTEDLPEGNGFLNMKERVKLAEGHFRLDSEKGAYTEVRAEFENVLEGEVQESVTKKG